MQRTSCASTAITFLALLSLAPTASARCGIYRIVVRPTGTITPTDTVALEIDIRTSTTPAHLAQPTQVTVAGNQILVDLYADADGAFSPDSMIATADIGTLPPGTYTYEIVMHPTEWCYDGETVTGTLCVQDPACNDDSCRCPVFTPTYAIVSVGGSGWYECWGQALNDFDEVVGRGGHSPAGGQTAFSWRDGVMVDLGRFGDDNHAGAEDVNNLGQVVGNSAAGRRAILWQDGEIIDIGNLGYSAWATAINDSGQIVGSSYLSGSERHAFLWENGVMTDLTEAYGMSAAAEDINELGQIVGYGKLLNPDGTIIELGTLGGEVTDAQAVNDHGQVVGGSERIPGERVFHAFFWENGEMTDLGVLGEFEYSSVVAINNASQVVGTESVIWAPRAFLYETGVGIRYLYDLIPTDSGWLDLVPEDINHAGHITGLGVFNGEYRAFLMMPVEDAPAVPSTSSWGKVILMLFVLAALTHVSRERIASP